MAVYCPDNKNASNVATGSQDSLFAVLCDATTILWLDVGSEDIVNAVHLFLKKYKEMRF